MGIRKFIGDKKFYKTLLLVALPIVLQNGITSFVSLLDNIMVGQVGTEQMSTGHRCNCKPAYFCI